MSVFFDMLGPYEQPKPEVMYWLERFAEEYPDEWPVKHTLHEQAAGHINLVHITENGANVGVFALQRKRMPSGRDFLLIPLLVGEAIHGWFPDLMKFFDVYAQATNVAMIAVHGRPGWDRLCRPYGYRRRGNALCKEIAHA